MPRRISSCSRIRAIIHTPAYLIGREVGIKQIVGSCDGLSEGIDALGKRDSEHQLLATAYPVRHCSDSDSTWFQSSGISRNKSIVNDSVPCTWVATAFMKVSHGSDGEARILFSENEGILVLDLCGSELVGELGLGDAGTLEQV